MVEYCMVTRANYSHNLASSSMKSICMHVNMVRKENRVKKCLIQLGNLPKCNSKHGNAKNEQQPQY